MKSVEEIAKTNPFEKWSKDDLDQLSSEIQVAIKKIEEELTRRAALKEKTKKGGEK